MKHKIKIMYVIHHSHTDIGYTDLQERVIDTQVDYIRTVLDIMKTEEYNGFRWNCETLFCVEQFMENANDDELKQFIQLVNEGKIGLSANYLNFTDLVDCEIYRERLHVLKKKLPIDSAMIADINGISMGYRDAMIKEGIKFLFMNVHCHHGMYPLYQNQNAFWWENTEGKRLLVWNGEHYNLGNFLGIKSNRKSMEKSVIYPCCENKNADAVDILHENLEKYITLCEDNGYKYDFIISAVSGVFCDNAPPSTEISENIREYNRRYPDGVSIQMVSLSEMYEKIYPKLKDAPVYSGDLTDWWASGVGSTPYAVKHYKDAQRCYHLCNYLDSSVASKYPQLYKEAQNNLLMYAEHTWGHSSTVTDPCDTMVLNLEMRKNSYSSKAHEAANRILNLIAREKGDIFRYYEDAGKIKVINVRDYNGKMPVEFYIENSDIQNMEVVGEDGVAIECQVSLHPRGRRISFVDSFLPHQEKCYHYRSLPAKEEKLNSRRCYFGAERILDIANEYDPITYRLPYEFENSWFKLCYRPFDGVNELIDKRTGQNLLGKGVASFFTPIYEVTPIKNEPMGVSCSEKEERRIIGRNIRGKHAQLEIGQLEDISCLEHGTVFTKLKLKYNLSGTVKAEVIIKLFEDIPRIDFTLQLGKTLSNSIESIFMPLSLNIAGSKLYIRKGTQAFMPGVEQIPGTCMEYYMSDDGVAYIGEKGSALISLFDAPLIYAGEMKHHAIRLCDGKAENNERPIYSWIMNNIWETNFKLDLSGFGEFNYSLLLSDETNPESAMDILKGNRFPPYVIVTE